MLRPDKFEAVFINWVNSLRDKNIDKEVIAIDGKTIRGSKDSFHEKSPIHIISAWANSNQLVLGQSKVDGKTNETRLYIISLNYEAEAFNKYIRMHWGVENSLHWTLDMTFREDEQRKRDKNSAQNFAIVRKIVLNLLKQEDSKKLSLRTKRLKAGWDNNFLLKILKI